MNRGVPVDLVFQSIAGTQAANASFGVTLPLLKEAHEAALAQKRGTIGDNVMYFETGQGSPSRRTPITASTSRPWKPGPTRWPAPSGRSSSTRWWASSARNTSMTARRSFRAAGGSFLRQADGVPLGVDVCYTNHAEADQDDMDTLLTLLGAAGVTYVMGVPAPTT